MALRLGEARFGNVLPLWPMNFTNRRRGLRPSPESRPRFTNEVWKLFGCRYTLRRSWRQSRPRRPSIANGGEQICRGPAKAGPRAQAKSSQAGRALLRYAAHTQSGRSAGHPFKDPTHLRYNLLLSFQNNTKKAAMAIGRVKGLGILVAVCVVLLVVGNVAYSGRRGALYDKAQLIESRCANLKGRAESSQDRQLTDEICAKLTPGIENERFSPPPETPRATSHLSNNPNAPLAEQEVALDTFIVNLVPEKGKQYLQTSITLVAKDQSGIDLLRRKAGRVRSRLLLILSAKRASEISTPGGQQVLQREMAKVLNAELKNNRNPEPVSDVLFTSFLIQ